MGQSTHSHQWEGRKRRSTSTESNIRPVTTNLKAKENREKRVYAMAPAYQSLEGGVQSEYFKSGINGSYRSKGRGARVRVLN